ncbi:MAG: hypothetical protein JWR77_1063 [Rhizorhabdus sp.]|nr:hypothetical protein [Rhizorhabdus sp.]
MLNSFSAHFPEMVVFTMLAFMAVIGAAGVEQILRDRPK